MALDGALRIIAAELTTVGLDPDAVCVAAGVDRRALRDDGGVGFGLAEISRVLAQAEAMSGDPLLGLHLAERTPGRGVLSYLARAQRTVGEGLAAYARFAANNWGTADAVRVEHSGGRATVAFHLGQALPRHVLEYVVTRTAISLGRSGAAAREVSFAHPPGGAAAEYQRVLRCPVRFAQDETRLVLRGADLECPLRTANPEAAAALAAALAQSAPRAATSVADRLAAAVDAALRRGERLDREALARALGMSGKTLARRLADERRLFRDVVDAVRRALAERLVAEQRLDLGEVAARVGFADPAAFGKAFRRWFGTSPSAYRAGRRAR